MFKKIKENLALVVTAITLLGSIGAGIQSLGAVLTTLSNIDERMYSIEEEFAQLRSETMVSSDIATLYEKINKLEQQASQFEYISSQIGYYDSEINNLKQELRDLEWKVDDFMNRDANFQDSQEYSLQKWEWQDNLKTIERIKSDIDVLNSKLWEVEDVRARLGYVEANTHNH